MASMMARFLINICPATVLTASFMFFLSFMRNWMPSTKGLSNKCRRVFHIWTLRNSYTPKAFSHQRLPALSWSWAVPSSHCRSDGVWIRRTIQGNIYLFGQYPWIPCEYESTDSCKHAKGCCPRNWCEYTCLKNFLMNRVKEIATSLSSSTKRLHETPLGNKWRRCLQTLST